MEWLKIVVPVITALIGAAAMILAEKLKAKRKEQKESTSSGMWVDHLDLASAIYERMEILRDRLGADRVLLLRCENGGGVPTPGATLYSTVVHECTGEDVIDVKEDWIRQPIDQSYTDMLVTVFRDGCTEIVADEIEGTLLGDIYERTGVAYSEVYKMLARPSYVLYLSINYFKRIERNAKHRDAARAGIARIKKVLSKMQDITDHAPKQ